MDRREVIVAAAALAVGNAFNARLTASPPEASKACHVRLVTTVICAAHRVGKCATLATKQSADYLKSHGLVAIGKAVVTARPVGDGDVMLRLSVEYRQA